jgi:hypothetical protein
MTSDVVIRLLRLETALIDELEALRRRDVRALEAVLREKQLAVDALRDQHLDGTEETRALARRVRDLAAEVERRVNVLAAATRRRAEILARGGRQTDAVTYDAARTVAVAIPPRALGQA